MNPAGRMIRPLFLCSALALTGCGGIKVAAPAQTDLANGLVRRTEPGPPPGPPGTCWAQDVTPAIIESVTEQTIATPAKRGPDGAVVRPATYRTSVQQKIVKDRDEVWFTTPCDNQLTLEFVATLQRALKARGLYLQPLTGQMDPTTQDAIRRYQEPLGLDSDILSLGAAQSLGIVAGDFRTLPVEATAPDPDATADRIAAEVGDTLQ